MMKSESLEPLLWHPRKTASFLELYASVTKKNSRLEGRTEQLATPNISLGARDHKDSMRMLNARIKLGIKVRQRGYDLRRLGAELAKAQVRNVLKVILR
jgi:hypothetical protein